MKLQWLTRCLTLLAIGLSGSFIVVAQDDCAMPTSHAFLDVNNVKARIGQGSVLWWDQESKPAYEVPKGTDRHSLFAGGLWIGGLNNQNGLHLSTTTYNQGGVDFRPGPIGASLEDQQAFDRHWKVNQSTIDSFKMGLFTDIPTVILEWPGKGNPQLSFLPDQDLAPFEDVNADGIYNAADGDYPFILGDQSIWYMYSDGNCENTSAIANSQIPDLEQYALKIDVHAEAFAFSTVPGLENITFYKLKILNRSYIDYHDVYLTHFMDGDLGYYQDDYVGTDIANRLSYYYNGNAVDQALGENIPIVAQQILATPADATGKEAPFAASVYYNNDFSVQGNPETPEDCYHLMRGYWKDGTPLTEGGDWYGGNKPNPFMFPDAPNVAGGLSECSNNNIPNDRRILQSVGPFDLDIGAVKEHYFAVLWTDEVAYPCPAITSLTDLAQEVQAYFDTQIRAKDWATGDNTAREQIMMKIRTFPNPAKAQINVSLKGIDAIDHVELIAIDGRVLYQSRVNGASEIIIPRPFDEAGISLLNLYGKEGNLLGSRKVMWE